MNESGWRWIKINESIDESGWKGRTPTPHFLFFLRFKQLEGLGFLVSLHFSVVSLLVFFCLIQEPLGKKSKQYDRSAKILIEMGLSIPNYKRSSNIKKYSK